MAFPPMVPTSFVPRSASSFGPNNLNLGSMIAVLCYGALVVTLFLAGGVFGYHWYLARIETAKSAELEKEKASIDEVTTHSFITLDNRLDESKKHLDTHVAFSNLFSVIESLEPITVRLSSLKLSFKEGVATLDAAGTATNFNALAAFSQILGQDGRMKDAVFSGLAISKTGVTFTLAATVDPRLTVFTGESIAATPVTQATTTTPRP